MIYLIVVKKADEVSSAPEPAASRALGQLEQLMCTAGKNNLTKAIQLFQVVKRIKSHDDAHEARG